MGSLCHFFVALFPLGLDSLCAPFLYLNFNNEGEYLFLLGVKQQHSLSSVSSCRQMYLHPLTNGNFL